MSNTTEATPIIMDSLRKPAVDEGGGGGEGQNEARKLKRKSNEDFPSGQIKRSRHWKAARRNKWKKFHKKPRSVDGDRPSTSSSRKKSLTRGPRRRRATESFNAPFNSTQFLMNDHANEATRHLDSTLNIDNNEEDEEASIDYTMERPMRRITRARESSFSIDSDEDYYYSSPEDEEEFMSKEFIKEYDNVRTNRLVDMSKAELINEYLQMEQKIEVLEKKLSANNSDDSKANKETMVDTIRKFQKEIQRLESENDELKHKSKPCSSCSTSCCSSSSESEDSSSSSESSESEDEEDKDEVGPKKALKYGSGDVDDTGYESGQSNKPLVKDQGLDPNEEKEVVVNNLISVNSITSTSS